MKTITEDRMTECREDQRDEATMSEFRRRLRLSTSRSLASRPSERGVALIITLILLAVVTFMALTFLAVSRRERNAVTTTTDTASAQLAADDALASAEGQIVANTLATTNPYNFGLLVSTNYINPSGFWTGVASLTNVNYYYPNGNPADVANRFSAEPGQFVLPPARAGFYEQSRHAPAWKTVSTST